MTQCTQTTFEFPVCKRRCVEADFEGGAISSDGGVLLLRQVDRVLGLSEAVSKVLSDPRRQAQLWARCGEFIAPAGIWVGAGV